MRAVGIGALVVLFAAPACSSGDAGADAGDSQERYRFAGCEDAGRLSGCPNMGIFYCALATIEARHDGCSDAGECVAINLGDCVHARNGCPPAAINGSRRAQYQAEALAEVRAYCDRSTCVGAASCAGNFSEGRTSCVGGRCVAVSNDGGLVVGK